MCLCGWLFANAFDGSGDEDDMPVRRTRTKEACDTACTDAGQDSAARICDRSVRLSSAKTHEQNRNSKEGTARARGPAGGIDGTTSTEDGSLATRVRQR
jgi:hypothetical protein